MTNGNSNILNNDEDPQLTAHGELELFQVVIGTTPVHCPNLQCTSTLFYRPFKDEPDNYKCIRCKTSFSPPPLIEPQPK